MQKRGYSWTLFMLSSECNGRQHAVDLRNDPTYVFIFLYFSGCYLNLSACDAKLLFVWLFYFVSLYFHFFKRRFKCLRQWRVVVTNFPVFIKNVQNICEKNILTSLLHNFIIYYFNSQLLGTVFSQNKTVHCSLAESVLAGFILVFEIFT